MEELLNNLTASLNFLNDIAHANELARMRGEKTTPLSEIVTFDELTVTENDIEDLKKAIASFNLNTNTSTESETSSTAATEETEVSNTATDTVTKSIPQSKQPEDNAPKLNDTTNTERLPELSEDEQQMLNRLPLSAKETILTKLNITFSKDKSSWSQKVANGVINTLLQLRAEETIAAIREEFKKRHSAN